jgi:hypothetical protein
MNERAMPNPNCTEQTELDLGVMDFGRLGHRQVQGCFDGGSMTRDAGGDVVVSPGPQTGVDHGSSALHC